MSFKCNGCGTNIFSSHYMECSNVKCRGTYDLQCVSMQSAEFENLTQDYKDKWICPECACLQPKSSNTNTPIRSYLDKTFNTSTNFVNTQRGTRPRSNDTHDRDHDEQLITEMRQFRLEVLARMDKQAENIEKILHLFCETKNEIREINSKMRVLEEKISAHKQMPKVMPPIFDQHSDEQRAGRSSSSSSKDTYSNVTQNNNKQAKRTKRGSSVTNKGVAPKPEILTPDANNLEVINDDDQSEAQFVDSGSGWKMVSGRKRKQKIMKGENTTLGIQAMERKKHLHVWRLQPETTSEQMESHVRSICGTGVCVEIQKINHKTDRGYSSFIVGVPERLFDTISQSNVWPRDAEFGEWIWFRRSSKTERK